ncbi:hypothetical protein HYG93_17595 [Acinetobacter sp. SwsAc6]|nr:MULTISPECIES: hypothetical protein [Acinetobacter]NWK76036.1 hypothetical protein [Acinetobacter sp. SwsAc6]QCO21056.1 hypothetical protein C9E88_005805 [Acinetobacter cumulans]RKG45707.1 hypothetical protein D7V68_15410 [Acinetobacter cumulans]
MADFYPFVVVKSNVPVKKLYYSFRIFNISTNKIVSDSGKKIKEGVKYPLKNNYQTELFTVISSVDSAKDMLIEFTLYKRDGVTFTVVIDKKIITNIVSEFTFDNIKNNKIKYDFVNYMEANGITKVVNGGNKNLVKLNITNKRIFVSTQHPVGDELDPFTKEKIQQGLLSRLKEKYPDQNRTNLCGPAAFFYCVLNANANIYKKIVKDLWEKGETQVNDLKIKPDKDGARTVKNYFDSNDQPLIPAVDWITLGSLRDSANIIFDYTIELGESPTAVSPPGDVLEWFRLIGFKKVIFYHIGENKFKALIETSNYDAKKYFIVLLTSSSILKGQTRHSNVIPTHWVVLDDNIKVAGNLVNSSSLKSQFVSFKAFSWGESFEQNSNLTLDELISYTWGVYIYERGLA